ncbi:MAG: porphobilinogen synthase [Alphaproteobacteria bacterium]|jgi:porphobilinogen synthase|tara:strand:- start:3160 stop:4176 length:1017 start_codon:yes stop_codon:yes gene_type:complete
MNVINPANNLNNYPLIRLRRNRQQAWSRNLISENNLTVNDLILPVFIKEGSNESEEITSMPRVFRHTIDKAVILIDQAYELGVPAVAIFPVIENRLKTADGKESYNEDSLMCRSISEIKDKVPNIGIIADVALDPFTTHGHDGLLIKGKIDNDKTIDILIKQSLAQAKAGCDIIAPSDMMDGRIVCIRNALESEGFKDTQIMSYAAKYASNFYGPFRDAIQSSQKLVGNKKSYQMDPSNSREAIQEAALDISEGADMIMVKPGMPYLDIITKIKSKFNIPIFAYQVSGEYSMMRAASENGWLDFSEIMEESLISFKRAGADGILTYSAIEMAIKLNNS